MKIDTIDAIAQAFETGVRDMSTSLDEILTELIEELSELWIPTLSGRVFQLEAGHHSEVKPATIPINIRPL